jgi:hypothetical protein
MRIKNQNYRKSIDYGINPEMDNQSIPKCSLDNITCTTENNMVSRELDI